VVFLTLFVKWALQTNKKNVFEEPAVSALREKNKVIKPQWGIKYLTMKYLLNIISNKC
jgi:hypothetical protein